MLGGTQPKTEMRLGAAAKTVQIDFGKIMMHDFDPAVSCPTLFRRRWNETGLADAVAAINVDGLFDEIWCLKRAAPSRASVGRSYLSAERGGLPNSTKNSNRLEELTAIAMANLNRRWPLGGDGYFRLIDYQTPLKAKRSDKGIGKIDLLAVTDAGRLMIVELKVRNRSRSIPDSPISALFEGLCYAVLIEANQETLRQEIEDRFGGLVSSEPPVVLVLAPKSWWRKWLESKAAGNWWPAFETLLRRIEEKTGFSILLQAFDDVALIRTASDTPPRLECAPSTSSIGHDAFTLLSHPSPGDPVQYLEKLNTFLWNWGRTLPAGSLDGLDGRNRPPVAVPNRPEASLILPPDQVIADDIASAIPPEDRHRYFGSFRSSQALAQTVFGALHAYERLDLLSGVRSECGRPAFMPAEGASLFFEHEVDTLSEPRPTSVDVMMRSDGYSVAIECKLTEAEFGRCSRVIPSNGKPAICDGSYSYQMQRTKRCALSALGIAYWDHLPTMFNWPVDRDHRPCPFKDGYQLARNLLAATVHEIGSLSPTSGHVLVVYDARNPAFCPGGEADRQFEMVSASALFPGLIRRVSWQTIAKALKLDPELDWLVEGLGRKYGFL